ncbi:hypothetical protein ES703_51142 [subsurface metagenome]
MLCIRVNGNYLLRIGQICERDLLQVHAYRLAVHPKKAVFNTVVKAALALPRIIEFTQVHALLARFPDGDVYLLFEHAFTGDD